MNRKLAEPHPERIVRLGATPVGDASSIDGAAIPPAPSRKRPRVGGLNLARFDDDPPLQRVTSIDDMIGKLVEAWGARVRR